MAAPKTSKRPRRRRVTEDKPLEIRGARVPTTEPRPPRAGWLARPMTALIAALPAVRANRDGRSRAAMIKIALGVGAALLIAEGREQIVLGVLGGIVALTILFLPLMDYRKRRLLAWARDLAKPGERVVWRPAELHYDGRKLVVRADERVWTSVRPRTPPRDVVIGLDGGRATLGLVLPGGKRSGALWFEAPADAVGPTYDPLEPSPAYDGSAVDRVVRVSGEDWTALHEVLWSADTGGLPRPKGPART